MLGVCRIQSCVIHQAELAVAFGIQDYDKNAPDAVFISDTAENKDEIINIMAYSGPR